jgi:hypothetical protein
MDAMTSDFADVLGNARYLFSMNPAPWSFYEGAGGGYVQDANGILIFGGEPHEGYVSDKDPEIVALVDTVDSLAVYMRNKQI